MNSNLYCNDVLFVCEQLNTDLNIVHVLDHCSQALWKRKLFNRRKQTIPPSESASLSHLTIFLAFTTYETFHRPTHRNEGPVTDHVSSSPTPSNINIGLGDFPANPIMKLESLLLQCIGLSRAQKITSCKPHIKGKQQPLFFCPIANEHISISHWIASLISCLVCNIITQRSGLQGSQTHSEKNNTWINHKSFSKLCNLYRC